MEAHWPVVLYCGWMLMAPPFGKGAIDEKAPLNQWTHMRSFDTAKLCQQFRLTIMDDQKKLPGVVHALSTSRCLPSDAILATK